MAPNAIFRVLFLTTDTQQLGITELLLPSKEAFDRVLNGVLISTPEPATRGFNPRSHQAATRQELARPDTIRYGLPTFCRRDQPNRASSTCSGVSTPIFGASGSPRLGGSRRTLAAVRSGICRTASTSAGILAVARMCPQYGIAKIRQVRLDHSRKNLSKQNKQNDLRVSGGPAVRHSMPYSKRKGGPDRTSPTER